MSFWISFSIQLVPRPKPKVVKWSLTLAGEHGVDLVFQALHSVVDVLLGPLLGKSLYLFFIVD
jgi:hypothetical protein